MKNLPALGAVSQEQGKPSQVVETLSKVWSSLAAKFYDDYDGNYEDDGDDDDNEVEEDDEEEDDDEGGAEQSLFQSCSKVLKLCSKISTFLHNRKGIFHISVHLWFGIFSKG